MRDEFMLTPLAISICLLGLVASSPPSTTPGSTIDPQQCDVCAQDKTEYCELFPKAPLCATPCGFEFDAVKGHCKVAVTTRSTNTVVASPGPIIGGSGKFRYQYMPNLLVAPKGASLVNCHGLSIDKDENIIMTYQNDGKTDPHCIIKWNPGE